MTAGRPRRVLSIAHSYSVALNRRLAHEMALTGRGEWEVTAAAPSFFRGDLRPIELEPFPGEASRLEPVRARLTAHIHVMTYGRRLKELLETDWDVVHCWEEPYILAGGQVARWTSRQSKLIFATFQNISKQYPPPFNLIERYSISRASGWIAFGNTVEEALVERRGYSAIRRRVIPPGVDLARFYPDAEARERIRRELGWGAGKEAVIGYLGRFVPEKGLSVLTGALDRIGRPWRALFVGEGPLEHSLRDWAARYPERVRVVTGVKHAEVPQYLNAMDVLCAPSQTTRRWREQLGRMLIEAFACGVAVICSRSGEIPNVVGDAGLVIGEKDEAEWAASIDRLIEDTALRSDLAGRGLEHARARYAWPVVARKHLDFFDEIIEA
ncbi:MAG TPA: glycosyltransferase family 4 protein [Blastocatellia bacterium]|nr:glycosyltransferase family 4 protein [Blastocatellia bacterium]